jgi:pilus assembly protein CpaB
LAGQQLVNVVVVTEPVDAGTPADDLALAVENRQIPAASRTPGALTDLTSVEGLVASVDLVPGEQLLAARFEDDSIRRVAGGDITIPSGLVEVTIRVEPTRAIGGQIVPGERVMVVATLTGLGDVSDTELEVPESGPVTGSLLREALVANIQSAAPDDLSSDEADRSRAAPAVDFLVTLALAPADVERLVFASEEGLLWLAREGEGPAAESGSLTSYDTVFAAAVDEALDAVDAVEADVDTSDAAEDDTEVTATETQEDES